MSGTESTGGIFSLSWFKLSRLLRIQTPQNPALEETLDVTGGAAPHPADPVDTKIPRNVTAGGVRSDKSSSDHPVDSARSPNERGATLVAPQPLDGAIGVEPSVGRTNGSAGIEHEHSPCVAIVGPILDPRPVVQSTAPADLPTDPDVVPNSGFDGAAQFGSTGAPAGYYEREADLSLREATLRSEQEAVALAFASLAERTADHDAREFDLAQSTSELSRREKLLEDNLAEWAKQRRRDGTYQAALARSRAKARAAVARAAELEAEREALLREVRSLRRKAASGSRAETTAQELQQQVDTLRGKLQTVRSDLRKATQGLSAGLVFSDPVIGAWLTEEPHEVFFEDVATSGSGPYEWLEYNRMLAELGFKVWEPSAACSDVDVLIVGRKGWRNKAVEAHVNARGSNRLRIYSQEMFLLAVAVGRDPYDASDEELLAALGDGHPALEALKHAGWAKAPEDDLPCELDNAGMALESPLRVMGYRVGMNGLGREERRKLLSRAFRSQIPEVETAAYMEQWGRPRTTRRLWRIASHLAWLANVNGKAASMRMAYEDWAEDLDWLYDTFAGEVADFEWPPLH